MYKSFEVTNFRGIRHLEVTHLSQTNIFTGSTDAGKTTILEALLLHTAGPLAGVAAVQALRAIRQDPLSIGIGSENAWTQYFHNFDMSKNIEFLNKSSNDSYKVQIRKDKTGKTTQQPAELQGQPNGFDKSNSVIVADRHGTDGERIFRQSINILSGLSPNVGQGISVEFKIDPQIDERYKNAYFIKGQVGIDLAREYSNFRTSSSNLDLVGALQKIDERITGLEVLLSGGRPQLHAQINSQLIPFPLLGDGINSMAQYLLAMAGLKDGILILDEVGAGIHFESLESMWISLAEASKIMNTQIFASTHSFECVTAAERAYLPSKGDLSIHRIDRSEGNKETVAVSYFGESLNTAYELHSELR